jgi:nucleoside-diphosphate-sugar epimerase
MPVLVTGAGMVGGFAAADLLKRGETPVLYDITPQQNFLATIIDLTKVKLVKGDILDIPCLIRTIQENNIDRIIHTAGLLTAGVRANPYAGITINISGTAALLEAARITGCKRVVFTSSGTLYYSSYAESIKGPYQEDFMMRVLSDRPKAIYPITKLSSEFIGLCYNDLYNVDFVALRFAGVYGPWIGVPSGIPGRLIDKFLKTAAAGRPVVIDEPDFAFSGKLDLLYAKDASKSTVLACMASNLKTRIYNIGTGEVVGVDEIVESVKRHFPNINVDYKTPIGGGFSGYSQRPNYPMDLGRAQTELGYQPDYRLNEGISDYVDWMRTFKVE